MITEAPEFIDPFLFATQKRWFQGQWELSKLTRLTPLLTDTNGIVEYKLEFGIDHKNIHFLIGNLNANISMRCQRCLEMLAQKVQTTISLCFVDEWNAVDALPKTYEPLVVETLPVSLNDIIEDEILLALPQAVLHKQKCSTQHLSKGDAGNLEPEKKQLDKHSISSNPFSVLAQFNLKNDS